MTLECCFASITVTRTAVSTRVKPGKDWSSSLGGPLPNGSHERNIIQCRSASLGSGVSTLTRSECHRHNQTWHGFQPELGKNWQPVQNTRNLYRCQPNQSSRRFVVRPRWEKGLAKTSLPKLFGNKSSYQLPTPWTMAPTTNLLIGIQVETHTHFCVGNAMACPVCTQLRWRVSGPKKWCLLSFKVAGFSIKLLCSLRQFELDFNWKPWKPNKKKTKKTYYIPLSPGLFISRTPLYSIQTNSWTALPAQAFDSIVPCNVHQHVQAFWRDFSNFNTSASLLEDSKAANNFLRLQLLQTRRQRVRECKVTKEPVNNWQVRVPG